MRNPDRYFNWNIPKEERKKLDERVGGTKDLVVIVRKISAGESKINIDKGHFHDYTTRQEKQAGYYMKKVINFALQQENVNPQNYEVSLLSCTRAENFLQEEKVCWGKSAGKSAGSTLYLALLSALHQKPISQQVAATGTLSLSTKIIKKGEVNEQEFDIAPGTNLPVRGLKEKTQAATQKGINRFVLSKYQSPPHILSEWQRRKWTGTWDSNSNKNYTEEKWILAENYQKEVSDEIKKKITVYWTENIQELRELIFQNKLS